jgi:hypothetical protein
MNRVGTYLAGAVVVGAVGLLLLANARSMVIGAWVSPSEVKNYSIDGGEGRAMGVTVLPGNKVATWYIDVPNDQMGAALVRWRGTDGDYYGLGFWYMGDAPLAGLNIRRLPRGFEPFVMEMTVLERWARGVGDDMFPAPGETGYGLVSFAKDDGALLLDDKRFERDELTPALTSFLVDVFEDEEAVVALRSAR